MSKKKVSLLLTIAMILCATFALAGSAQASQPYYGLEPEEYRDSIHAYDSWWNDDIGDSEGWVYYQNYGWEYQGSSTASLRSPQGYAFGTTNGSTVAYDGASTDATQIDTLPDGATIELMSIDATGAWYKILYNDNHNAGWIQASAVR